MRGAAEEERSPYGLLLYRPGRTARTAGTLLFHTEHGLSRTLATVIANGVRYRPEQGSCRIEWEEPVENGTILVRWMAGHLNVEERFRVDGGTLLRSIAIAHAEKDTEPRTKTLPSDIAVQLALYANPLLFSRFAAEEHHLVAEGYEHLVLETSPPCRTFERFITVSVPESGEVEARYRSERGTMIGEWRSEESPQSTSSPGAVHSPQRARSSISRQCAVARNGLRASIDRNGRFLASLMQYEFAWGLDAAMVASGAAMLGESELATRVLGYTLDHLVNEQGMVAEADRFRDGELAELNGNGALLCAALDVGEWTGAEAFIAERWERIAAVADYLLQPEFQHSSGLLVNRRDFWERTPWMGVEPGAELGHQVFAVVGLRAAAQMAEQYGTQEQGERWQQAAIRIEQATLHSPTHSLVERERFIKRRHAAGHRQRTIAPDPDWFDPEYAPYLLPPGAEPGEPVVWEPDTVTALPIVYGLVPPEGALASNTLDRLEALWSPTGTGGYARYNPAADLDSPGSWPFATMWIAAAQLEAGRLDAAARSIRWLLDAAGPGGAWREFSGKRATPPFPPIGVIVWAWAQWGILVVRHILGARIENKALVVAPRLAGLDHTIVVGGGTLRIVVDGLEHATLDGAPRAIEAGAVRLPLPRSNNALLHFT